MRGETEPVLALDILILAGDPAEVHAIRAAFGSVLNRVEVFEDPDRARDYILKRAEFANERRTADLIVIDAEMVGEGCWGLIEQVQRRREYADSVMIVLSGDVSFEKAERARKSGVEVFVPKPVRTETLHEIGQKIEDGGLALVRKVPEGWELNRG